MEDYSKNSEWDPYEGNIRDFMNNSHYNNINDRAKAFDEWRSCREKENVWPYQRFLDCVALPQNTLTYSNGKSYYGINFSSQDYLSLSSHPEIKIAAAENIEKYGVHSAGSPTLSGNINFSHLVEEKISQLLNMNHVLLYTTGWLAGYGVIKGLVRPEDHIVMDVLAHNCLQEGALASTKNIHHFLHLKESSLERTLRKIRTEDLTSNVFVVTEGLFSMDSDSPDLTKTHLICRNYNAHLIVDVAHDLGNSGPGGSGQLGIQQMLGKADLVIGSFSKTFASNGGFVATNNKSLKEYLKIYSPSHVFSNGMSPIQISIINKALDIVMSNEGDDLRKSLHNNINCMRDIFLKNNFVCYGGPSPIIPVIIGPEKIGRLASKIMSERGVLANLVEFPAVKPNHSRLRLQVMANHTLQQCKEAAEIISDSIKIATDYVKQSE
jgi:7-keto-8-aminopelargonate synthetase-like enzyme